MANVLIGNQKYYSETNGFRTYVISGYMYGNQTPDNRCYYAETSGTNPEVVVIPDGLGSLQNYQQNTKIPFGNLFFEWEHTGDGSQITSFTVKFYDSDGETLLQSKALDLHYYFTDSNDIAVKNLNFYVRLNTATNEIYPDTFGIMCMVTGYVNEYTLGGQVKVPMRVYQFPYSEEFDNATVKAEVQLITEVFGTSQTSDETIETVELNESDGFLVSVFPDEVYQLDEFDFNDHLVYPDQTIKLKHSEDGTDYYYSVWSWYGSPPHVTDKSPDDSTIALDFSKYYEKLGSDMLRKTGEDKYYNGIDLATSSDPTENHLITSGTQYISFANGKIRLDFNSSRTMKVALFDKNDNMIGTEFSRSTSGSIGIHNYAAMGNNCLIACWLAKRTNNQFYLVGMMTDSFLYDSDGNRLLGNDHTAGAFVILKKFGNEQNEFLANSIVTKTTPNKQNIDEEELQQPENQPKDDDVSTWEDGDLAGENTGIRHNGSDIVDGSDLSQTADEQVEHISAPDESSPTGYPTPMNTGMIAVFNPTKAQLQAFASDLTDDSVLTKITKYLASNPMDIIISCHICILPEIDTGNEYKLKYGLYQSDFRMPVVTQRFYECDMGYLNLREYGNSWKDYEPTTKLTIYLPCIGFRQIDADAVMGMELKLKYIFDVITGDVLAELSAVNEASKVDNPFYIWQGNTMSKFPFTANDYDAQIQNSINGVLGTASALGGAFTGNFAAITGGLASALNSAHNMKPQIRCTGTVTSAFTHMMGMTPYIIRQVPMNFNAIPYQYKHLQGQMSNAGVVIGDVMSQNTTETKYVKFISADIDGIGAATEEEKQMILSMLQGGVYI